MLTALKNLFSFRTPKSVPSQTVPDPFEYVVEPAAEPLSVAGEVKDCSLVLLGLITDLTEHLRVDLFNSRLFQLYQSAVHGETLPEGYDQDDLEQMQEWAQASHLPEHFRKTLLTYFIRVDGLDEHVLELSQYRYERLRTWSNCNG